MNLLHAQKGLCAYTEIRLCNEDLIAEDNWSEGCYNNHKPEIFGQLDHFDPKLKKEKAWLWDNMFIVHSDINTKVKGKKEVDYLMKPDTKDYDEVKLLEYDCDKNVFIANSKLTKDLQKRINDMILKLGINYDPVLDRRRRFLSDKLLQIKLNIETWESIKIDEFPTAFTMCKIQQKNSSS